MVVYSDPVRPESMLIDTLDTLEVIAFAPLKACKLMNVYLCDSVGRATQMVPAQAHNAPPGGVHDFSSSFNQDSYR